MQKTNKKTFRFSVILLTLLACNISSPTPPTEPADIESQVPATPTPTPKIVPAPKLTQFDMIDENVGWGQAEGMILRTEDGGETWFDITPNDVFNDPAYAKSAFLDADTGWVLIEDVDGPMVGTIFRTTDGGTTWLWRNTPFGRSDIGFLDAENGYALTGLGAGAGSEGIAIWETKNGGGDWNRTFIHQPGLDDSLPLSGIKNGIGFRDPLNGWVAGVVPQDGFAWLYRTRDGGFTWEHQPLDFPAGFENAQASVFAPIFFNEFEGILPVQLLAKDFALGFYLTENGGETWTVNLPAMMSGKYALASARDIWVWDGGAVILLTDNGGATWEFRATDLEPGDSLASLDLISASTGWALTDTGLYRTTDGGRHWQLLVD
ncbi:MAG: hypothetical protein L3J16_05075 [Anaerolineales bacterium]|nr:hypothetical protein [Anaerolineales bacterium]